MLKHGAPIAGRSPPSRGPRARPAVHFWAPAFKWGITFANIADLQRPAEKVSVPQQTGGRAPGCAAARGTAQPGCDSAGGAASMARRRSSRAHRPAPAAAVAR